MNSGSSAGLSLEPKLHHWSFAGQGRVRGGSFREVNDYSLRELAESGAMESADVVTSVGGY